MANHLWLLRAVIVWTLLTIVWSGRKRPLQVTDEVWFEIEIRDFRQSKVSHYTGNVTIALFGEVVPLTVRNFVEITRGFRRPREFLSYRGSPIHRIVREFLIQGGDIKLGDGSGGTSIYGEMFTDENFELKHRSAGWVSMANRGQDTNASQFLIMLTRAKWLDGIHVVFGKVIKGFDTIWTVANQTTDIRTQRPKKFIRILNCGVNDLTSPYEFPKYNLDSEKDL